MEVVVFMFIRRLDDWTQIIGGGIDIEYECIGSIIETDQFSMENAARNENSKSASAYLYLMNLSTTLHPLRKGQGFCQD